MPNPLGQTLLLLIQLSFNIAWLVIFIRLMMPFWQLPSHHPVLQGVVKATQPIIRPLRQFIPAYRQWDGATLLILVILSGLKATLTTTILYHTLFSLPALLIWSLAESLDLLQDIYFWAILLMALSSWLNPSPYHPAVQLLYQVTRPLIAPIRQRLPNMAGLDFSPMIALVLLQISKTLIISPLYYYALQIR